MKQRLPESLKRHRAAALILVAFVILGTIYSVVTPIFEASDELWHYPVVKHIADGKGLPVQKPGVRTAWRQEGGQPPLYYALAALATFWIDTDDMQEVLWYNPHAIIGIPGAKGNKNMIVHTAKERFPYSGTVLAVHIIRFISVLLQAITVLATYLLALEMFPDRKEIAMGAMALVAFTPMFLFIAGSVNNDNLVTPLCSLALLLMIRLVRNAMPANWSLVIGHWSLLGLLVGLASLAKVSGLGLLPLSIIVLASIAIRRRSLAIFLKGSLTVVGVALLVAGWWYLRNWIFYGDPLGWSVWLEVARQRKAISFWELLGEWGGFRASYWAVFGGFNIAVEEFIYRILDAFTLLGIGGVVLRASRRERLSLLWIPALWTAAVLAGLIHWTSLTKASQGRLMFPAISAISVLLFWGLSAWLPRRHHGALASLIGGAFLLSALISPFRYIAPAYARPPILSPDELPPDLTPLHVNYGGKMELLGCKLQAGSSKLKPGNSLPVTLCWQSLAEMEEDYSVFVHLFGRDEQPLGQVDSYPGLGSYPTSLWREGDIICEFHRVPISEDAICPTACRVDVGLYQLETMEGLQAYDEEGRPLGRVSVGRAKLAPRKWPKYTIEHPLQSNLAGKVALIGFKLDRAEVEPGGGLKLTLYWKALAGMGEDYTVFTHLIDEEGEIWAQDDGQPLGGYYPTSLWGEGEVIEDEYTLTLDEGIPQGGYQIEVGMYLLKTGERLPIVEEGKVVGDRILLRPAIIVR